MSAELVERIQGKKDQMEVHDQDRRRQADAGRQAVGIKGVSGVNFEKIEPRLSNEEGQPFSEANVSSDRDAITYYYYNQGFPNVQFEATANPDPKNAERMDVVYKITEGQSVFVNRVVVTGLEFTRPYVVNRQMRIEDGDPLSQDRWSTRSAACTTSDCSTR